MEYEITVTAASGVEGVTKRELKRLGVEEPRAVGGAMTFAGDETMIARCKGPKIVVADGSKIGNSTSFYTCPVTDISCLVTDTSADPEELQRIRNTGVEVVVVDPYAPAP